MQLPCILCPSLASRMTYMWIVCIQLYPKPTHLNCNQGAAITQLCTGHALLAQHLKRIKRANLATCTHCKQAKEDVLHYLIRCPAHEHTRTNLKQNLGRGAANINNLLAHPIAIIHLLQYINDSGWLQKTFARLKTTKEQAEKLRLLVKTKQGRK